MDNITRDLQRQIGKKRKNRKIWKNIFTSLAVIVVFCTTYALILPAISKERTAHCGKEPHVHEAACYVDELICGHSDEIPEEDSTIEYHQHGEDCYTETTNIICPITSRDGHSHTEE